MLAATQPHVKPKFEYPEVPELGVREKLLMEREATGMYFSGQMLDEYSKHVEILKPESISDYVGDECDPVDKARVSLAGIVTSVTLKNTKNGDRMAFFTIEDRMAEIECIAFARQYGEYAHLIHTDSGVFVSGTVSVREDEPPKILINRIEGLVENIRFRPEDVAPRQTAQGMHRASAESRPQASVPTAAPAANAAPRRLFLRVPNDKDKLYLKALNLAELFDGTFPVYFFFADEKRYEVTPHGVAVSDYVLSEFRALLGEENVILK